MSETVDAAASARYLYCLVDAEADTSLSVQGVDEAPVSVVTVEGVGAVTSPAPASVEADSETAVKRLLVAHQRVVDAAMEQYGAPLPIQATTAIDGDESTVRSWLAERTDSVAAGLAELAGHREYHVTVTWDDDAVEAAARRENDELDALERAVDDAAPGEAYLREKQYERALADAVNERAAELAAATRERVADVARSVVDRDGTAAVSFVDGGDDPVVSLAALAPIEREEALGEALDDVADRDGVTVRFTGPWAPYSFAPDVEGGDE